MLCHNWALLCHAVASPNVALPTRCLTLLCRCLTALIGSDQYHAGAHLSSTVPLRRKSILCQSVSPHCHFGALTLIAIPILSHSMPRRIVSMSDRSYLCHNDTWLNSTMPLRLNALLCRSYTCPCQCSATPRPRYSSPKPSSAHLRLAHALLVISVPSPCLSLPSLERAIQCLCHAHLSFAHALLVISWPVLI